MYKMPPLKVLSTRSSWIPNSRKSTSTPIVLRTQSRLAALMILVALVAMISFPSSSASSLSGFLRGHNPGSIAASSSGFNSTNDARQPFRASLRTDLRDNEPATSELHIARKGHTATALSDGKIVIIGGENQEGQVEGSEVYDPNDGTFLLSAKLNIARANHTATKLADGRILVVGGHNRDGSLRSTEVFDSKTNRFDPGPSLLQARSGHTATVLTNGRILIVGGDSNGTAEVFDPTGMKFVRVKGRMTAPRSSHSAILLKSGEVLLVGGLSPDGSELSSGELFDPDSSQFKPTRNPLFGARVRPMLRLLPDGKVQIIGGDDDQRSMEMFNTEGRYFTARAKILPDTNSRTGIEEVMHAASRAALINKHRAGESSVLREPLDSNDPFVRLLDRSEYTITELPETFSALVTGGISGSGTTLTSTLTIPSSSATVTTDKTDYQPGETVLITGTNWQPGEIVQLTLHRDNYTPDTVLTSVSDQDGNISNSDYVVQESDLNVAFLLTAVGQTSGYTAQTTFTDSRTIFSVSLNGTRNPITVSAGASITVVIFVTTSADGSANWRSTSWLISTTPSGTSTCVDHPNHDGVGFFGETFSITAPTSAGVYNAYFIAYQDDGCTSGASTTYMTNTVTVVQSCTSPTITCPSAVSVQCDSNVPAAATDLASFVAQGGSASLSSPSCGPLTVTLAGETSSGSCPKTITRTYRASDGFGHQATCTQTITVRDTTAPTINCPPPVNVQCDADVPSHATDLTSLVNQGGSASDNCGVPTVTFVSDASSGSCPKTITRTYRATDSCGNATTCTQTITVNDTVAPSITCPPPVSVQCDADVPAHATNLAGLVTQGGNASDNCGSPTVEFVSDASSGSCPKTITRTYRATDRCGNFTECTQVITIRDTIAPTLTCPPPVSVQCEANVPAHANDLAGLVNQGGNASDNCGVPTVRFVSDVASGSCPKTITRTYRATDGCGNSVECTQTITIRDTISPTLTCPPRVTVQCDSDVPAYATDLTSLVAQGGSASDNCGVPTVTFVSDVSSGSCPRIITRTYKATDGCGNEAICTQRIMVRDTIAPSITCPSDIVVQSGISGATVVVYPLPVATDNCVTPSVVCSPPSGSVFQVGVTRVTCVATDACGNSSSCSFSVSVCYSFLGFFSPVENPPMSNRVKAGQTVPLKFQLMAGQNYISDLTALMYLESANLSDCLRDRSGQAVDERGSSQIHYDSVENQFVINWKTRKGWANSCRKFVLTLNDGSTHVLYFDFTK